MKFWHSFWHGALIAFAAFVNAAPVLAPQFPQVKWLQIATTVIGTGAVANIIRYIVPDEKLATGTQGLSMKPTEPPANVP